MALRHGLQDAAATRLRRRALILTPMPPAPLPRRGEGRVDFTALAPLGERVARRGVFVSRGETGEGVSPMVKSNMGHHASAEPLLPAEAFSFVFINIVVINL